MMMMLCCFCSAVDSPLYTVYCTICKLRKTVSCFNKMYSTVQYVQYSIHIDGFRRFLLIILMVFETNYTENVTAQFYITQTQAAKIIRMTIINQLIKHLKTTLDRCLRVDHVDDASKRLELKKELSDDFKVRSRRR